MLGQTAVGSVANTPSGSRMFRYEVVGLRQNDQTDQMSYPIRNSAVCLSRCPTAE